MTDYTPPLPIGAILGITSSDVFLIAEITDRTTTKETPNYSYHLEEHYASDNEPTHWDFTFPNLVNTTVDSCDLQGLASFKNSYPEYLI